MKMKRTDKGKVAPEILMGIDLANSLNGGSSMVEAYVEDSQEGYEGFVRVPGVSIDEISIEVIQGRVVVYHMFPVYHQDSEEGRQYARVVGNFPIPADADYESVTASYSERKGWLKIVIPFNERRKGYRSTVEIER